uniref:Uncharacterized protein n=1 Tax=Malurus cyaneus samueli TaxID=2593467 RepID=A0A8C5TD12_9PASS
MATGVLDVQRSPGAAVSCCWVQRDCRNFDYNLRTSFALHSCSLTARG